MLASSLLKSVGGFKTFLINANTTNVSLFAVAGSPTIRGKYRFVITSGTVVGQTLASVAAVLIGQFPSGSELELYNYGSIQGRGGAAGIYSGSEVVGGAGGDCIKADYLNQSLKIFNYGEIKAGGGGGASGGAGGAGGIGGRGNITSTGGFSYVGNTTGWWVHDPGHTDILLGGYQTYSFESNVGNTPGTRMDGSATRALLPYGINDRGAQSEPYGDDGNGLGPRIVYQARLNTLQPPGANGATASGGNGGQGQGYNQIKTNGVAGVSNAGSAGSNGAGIGGSSGLSGTGANGGDWAQAGGAATNGTAGTSGTGGTADTFGEAGTAGAAGGAAKASGAAGRAIIKGITNVTIVDNGTILGAIA